MKAQAGVARTTLSPFWGVELTGWGYYLQRQWRDVHDPLSATALVVEGEHECLAVVSLDLMIISAAFTKDVRQHVAAQTQIPAANILLTCTHTHNAPSSGGLLGVGEVDKFYEQWAARQAATAVIQAWNWREPATFSATTTHVAELTFNRTRENGPVDPTLTTLHVERENGSSLAVLVGFQAHPTVSTVLRPWSVSRDVPGRVCDHLEAALPGTLAMYVQGACGDVNFHREFSTPDREAEPPRALADVALIGLSDAQPLNAPKIAAACRMVTLPTRRWTLEEINSDRIEAEQRLRDHDLNGWRNTIGRAMTNRPDDMVARHGGDEWKAVAAMCRFNSEWTELMLVDLDTRAESLETEIQALQIGEFGIVSNSSEFFTTLAMDVRAGIDLPHLALACYANGRIGYLPDAHDVDRRTYAAWQSPKYCNQFPFTAESGPVIVREMIALAASL